jgi:hypothetical protein
MRIHVGPGADDHAELEPERYDVDRELVADLLEHIGDVSSEIDRDEHAENVARVVSHVRARGGCA